LVQALPITIRPHVERKINPSSLMQINKPEQFARVLISINKPE